MKFIYTNASINNIFILIIQQSFLGYKLNLVDAVSLPEIVSWLTVSVMNTAIQTNIIYFRQSLTFIAPLKNVTELPIL